jgi:tRNA A-37 threonylcarbamoyl transferase component Bud32
MVAKFGIKRVVRPINRGGMGAVEEVELLDGTRAAKKTFSPDALTYTNEIELSKLRKRFEREVKYQTELGRHGAMPVLGSDLRADPPLFVMPLADKSYADQIKEDRANSRISPEPLADILSGLEQIHELGYVHRDLKPENVLYWQGHWRLSDFGLAANIVSTATSRFTTLSSWGTQGYMAPEQMTDFKNVTPAADMYAFGCVLHELIDGTPRVPYAAQTVSGPYDFIVRKCTQTQPDKRFRSISGLRAALLDELRRDPSLVLSSITEEWSTHLASLSAWDAKRFDEFLAYLEEATPGAELHVIANLREEHFDILAAAAGVEWEPMMLAYCEWARASFTFSFCDVIGGCLRKIYGIPRSGVSIKANVATAVATLAARNNRWYCMRLLNPMTDSSIPDVLAKRIAMEIRANDLHEDFEHCAREVFGWSRSAYHRSILEALDELEGSKSEND